MTASYAHDAGVLADGVLVVRRVPRMQHPGAHRDGIALLGQLITAGQAWDAMTRPQRRLVGDLCRPLLAALTEGDEVQPPALPAEVRTQTVASLRRKQLAHPDRLELTGLAVLAAQHGPALAARRRGVLPVDTIRPIGGVL